MDRKSSLFWILFLLAALFLGPTVILRTMDSQENRLPALRPGEHAHLRMIIAQEKLLDAPASLPGPVREDSADLPE